MTADLNANTPQGALAFCEYLVAKGYGTAAQVNPWRTAIQRTFETVEGDDWEGVDLATVDLEEYFSRFQKLAGAKYKAESILAYRRRVTNALDAHAHYRATGKPPTFKSGARSPKSAPTPKSPTVGEVRTASVGAARPATPALASGLMTFPWQLDDGQILALSLPPRLRASDVVRLCAFLRSLQDVTEEQKQIPGQTGNGRS